MKSKIWVGVAMGLLVAALGATVATAQCTNYPGMMIKFDGDAWAYETAYTAATLMSAPGSQLTVVGTVSVFCFPFTDLDPLNPGTEYTFIWDGLSSQGTVSAPYGIGGLSTQYTTNYVGGSFRIYAGSPRNAPTAATLPALPAPGVVPNAFADGTMILGGGMGPLAVVVTRLPSGSCSGSFRANYWATGGTLYNRVGDAISVMQGSWCPVPQGAPAAPGTCSLPAGWSAHPNGKWDMPVTVSVLPSTWGKIKTLYR